MRAASLLAVVLSLTAGAIQAQTPTRLILVGGGERPAKAMSRFVEWAGGAEARILVVSWASVEPLATCESTKAELAGAGVVICAPFVTLDDQGKAAPLAGEARTIFSQALSRATGVFFSGGDQNRVMDALGGDPALLAAIRARYAAGAVFGGTSAGAAVMSDPMVTDEAGAGVLDGKQVGVRPGLGLLAGAIVDPHFVKRQRVNRLLGLVLEHPRLRGVGVDEDTALLIRDGRTAEVAGHGPVLLVDATGTDQLQVTVARPGQTIDLRPRPRPGVRGGKSTSRPRSGATPRP